MPSLSEATGDIVGTIRGVVGLSRSGRVREQIDHTLALYERVDHVDGLGAAKADLEAVIGHHAAELLRLADPSVKSSRDWFGFMVIFVLLIVPAAVLTYWGYTFTDDSHWWSWLWTGSAGLLTLTLLIANVGVLSESSNKSNA